MSTSEPLVAQVALAMCCASRCEGCLGNGEGGCFDIALWRREAEAAIAVMRKNDPKLHKMDEVISAARAMPRRTPAAGGAGTIHKFDIEASTVWALDRALKDYDAAHGTQADNNRLVTITIGIDRNGDVHEDTQCHGNSWADVYKGIHEVKARINELIDNRRECPFIPPKVQQ
jgi:hypothetical protein